MALLDRLQDLLNNVMHVQQVTIEHNNSSCSIYFDARTIYLWTEIRSELFAVAKLDVSEKEFEQYKYDIARLLRKEFFYPVYKQGEGLTYAYDSNAMILEFSKLLDDAAPAES